MLPIYTCLYLTRFSFSKISKLANYRIFMKSCKLSFTIGFFVSVMLVAYRYVLASEPFTISLWCKCESFSAMSLQIIISRLLLKIFVHHRYGRCNLKSLPCVWQIFRYRMDGNQNTDILKLLSKAPSNIIWKKRYSHVWWNLEV